MENVSINISVTTEALYGNWAALEPCSVTCGGGEMPQSRNCISGPCSADGIFRV